MKIWENRAIELFQQYPQEYHVLDILQLEMKQAGVFVEEHLVSQRIDIAQQIINNVKDK